MSSLDTVERFDPDENTWSMVSVVLACVGSVAGVMTLVTAQVSNMTKHRSAAGVVTLLGKIYALGGHNGLSIFDRLVLFNPEH